MFVALIPPHTAPEVAKKLAREYIVCIYPEENKLKKYIDVLELVNCGLNLPQILEKLKVNKSSLRSRFKRLFKYGLVKKIKGSYRNRWEITLLGFKFLEDYTLRDITPLETCLKGEAFHSHNEYIVKLVAMRYWFFVNPSGHITKRKLLSESEKFVGTYIQQCHKGYVSQYTLTTNIAEYPIKRLLDGFVSPNIVIEVKNIDSDTQSISSLAGGQLVELLGQAMFIKDFYPSYRVFAVLLGKSKYVADLPLDTMKLLSTYVDGIYKKESLKGLAYAIG